MRKMLEITLNEEMLCLIANFNFVEYKKITDEDSEQQKHFGIDLNSIYGGNFILEDISQIIGIYDRHIEGTEYDYDGPKFNDEDTQHMLDLHSYIMDNLGYIEQLVHQFSWKGGLVQGTYVADAYSLIWEKKDKL